MCELPSPDLHFGKHSALEQLLPSCTPRTAFRAGCTWTSGRGVSRDFVSNGKTSLVVEFFCILLHFKTPCFHICLAALYTFTEGWVRVLAGGQCRVVSHSQVLRACSWIRAICTMSTHARLCVPCLCFEARCTLKITACRSCLGGAARNEPTTIILGLLIISENLCTHGAWHRRLLCAARLGRLGAVGRFS